MHRSNSKGPINTDTHVEPVVDCAVYVTLPTSNTTPEQMEPVIGEQPVKNQEESFPINGNLPAGSVLEPVSPVVSSSASYPIVDLSDASLPFPVQASSTTVDVHVPVSSEQVNEKTIDMQAELKELDELENELNRRCRTSGDLDSWDMLLQQLYEMVCC